MGCLQGILSFQAKTVKRTEELYICANTTNTCNDALARSTQDLFQGPIYGDPSQRVLKILMLSKAVPDGPKPQECEWGSRCDKLPIPYIPKEGKLHELVLRLTLPGKVELQLPVCS